MAAGTAGPSAAAPSSGKASKPSSMRRVLLALCLALSVAWLLQASAFQDTGGLRVTLNGGARPAAGQPKHIYVVGCGHSGTSILKRTIANLPGLLCLEVESEVFIHSNNTKPAKTEAILASLQAWDAQAVAGGFEGWVEKTPRHVLHMARLFSLDPSARVVFIVRDGRDVAASIQRRGHTFEEGMNRWVGDNTAALRHLRRPGLLTVKYEEFSNASTVLDVVRRVADFVGAPASTAQLLLALQPPTALLGGRQQCLAYASEAEKEVDLAASALQLLAGELGPLAGARAAAAGGGGGGEGQGQGGEADSSSSCEGDVDSCTSSGGSEGGGAGNGSSGGSEGGGGGGRFKGAEPRRTDHITFRAWQASQAWAPHGSTWRTALSEEQPAFAANSAAKKLLRRFGYEAA